MDMQTIAYGGFGLVVALNIALWIWFFTRPKEAWKDGDV